MPSPTATPRTLPAPGGEGVPMLPAEWLDETLARARELLHRDDPFMRALEGQREPVGELAWPAPAEQG